MGLHLGAPKQEPKMPKATQKSPITAIHIIPLQHNMCLYVVSPFYKLHVLSVFQLSKIMQ